MNIDLILDSRAGPDEIAELGKLAERYGIGAIWTSSLLDARDPFTNLTVLARETSKIRMGPIAVNSYDIHPVRIATSLLTLNEFAEGRANIVIGGGGEALQALNIKPEKRVGMVKEAVEILTSISPEAPLNFEGKNFQVKGYQPHWAKAPAPQIMVGANMPQMLSMAAQKSDGIFVSDLPTGLASGAIQTAKEAARKSDRNPSDLRFNNFFAWHVYEDGDHARKEATQWLALRGLFRRWVITTFLSDEDYDIIEAHMPQFFRELKEGKGRIEGVSQSITDTLVDNLTLCGGPEDLDQIAAHLKEFEDIGMTDISLRLYKDPAQSIKFIGERLMPSLRS